MSRTSSHYSSGQLSFWKSMGGVGPGFFSSFLSAANEIHGDIWIKWPLPVFRTRSGRVFYSGRTHSGAEDGGLVFAQVFPSRNIMEISVCDSGIGISGSVRQSYPAWNGTDNLALELASRQGWTSKKGSEGKGHGLYLVEQMIQHNGLNGRLVLISGNAIVLNRTTYEEIGVYVAMERKWQLIGWLIGILRECLDALTGRLTT